MTRPMVRIINGDEVIDREMNDEEFAEYQAYNDPAAVYQRTVADIEMERRGAYAAQSDPLFFEWQRGDGTEQAWLDAVAAVKAAHPYPPAP